MAIKAIIAIISFIFAFHSTLLAIKYIAAFIFKLPQLIILAAYGLGLPFSNIPLRDYLNFAKGDIIFTGITFLAAASAIYWANINWQAREKMLADADPASDWQNILAASLDAGFNWGIFFSIAFLGAYIAYYY